MLKDRILAFMQDRALTASRLAEAIGVQPSSISHILSGRNKPGYDFFLSILNHFPEIDPDWLLTGRGSMYRKDAAERTTPGELSTTQAEADMLARSSAATTNTVTQPDLFALASTDETSEKVQTGKVPPELSSGLSAGTRHASDAHSEIEKIIILYTDGTFAIYANR